MTPSLIPFLLRAGYVVIIAFATLAEPSLGMATHVLGMRLEGAMDPGFSGRDIVDAARNVLLFAGWGAVWYMTSPPGPAKRTILRATLSGALLSVAVESFQLIVPTRTPSAIDLITNITGSVLGALAAALMVLFVRAGRGERSFIGAPAATFAGAYGAAVLLEAFSPLFRQDRTLGAWGAPGERFGQALSALEWSSLMQIMPSTLLLAAPAGLFAVAALVEAGTKYPKAWPRVALAGGLSLAVAEFARGAVGHEISLGAIVSTAGGVALGAWAGARVLPVFSKHWRGSARPRLLWWAYVVLLLLWAFRPFYPELDGGMLAQKLSFERWIPLLSYRERVDLFTVVDVAVGGLLVLPVGGLLAVWPLRRRGWLSGPWPVLYVACVAEFAQVFVAGRWFDATDMLVQGAAALLGWSMVRRAGYRPYGEALPKSGVTRSTAA